MFAAAVDNATSILLFTAIQGDKEKVMRGSFDERNTLLQDNEDIAYGVNILILLGWAGDKCKEDKALIETHLAQSALIQHPD